VPIEGPHEDDLFWIAKLEDDDKLTRTDAVMGTAAYMAPEQAKGRSADKRSDVWALGCVMYEMFTGTRPFRGEDVALVAAGRVPVIPKVPWGRIGYLQEHVPAFNAMLENLEKEAGQQRGEDQIGEAIDHGRHPIESRRCVHPAEHAQPPRHAVEFALHHLAVEQRDLPHEAGADADLREHFRGVE